MNLSLLCFGVFPVAKKFMDKRGGYQYFQSEFFCLTLPKSFVRSPFCAMFQKTNGSEKDFEEGGESIFSPENFLSHSAENFRKREFFGVPLFLGIEIVSIRKGGRESRFSVKKALSHSDERFRRQPFCAVIQKLLLVKNYTDERGGEHQVFLSSFFYITMPKISVG